MQCPSSILPLLQLLATIALGIGAATIAFMQWRTAHQKIVLDLMERRISVIESCKDLVFKRLDDELFTKEQSFSVRTKALFLFDKNIVDRIHLVIKSVEIEGPISKKLQEQVSVRMAEIYKLAAPFATMDQKLVRTPLQWFRDRNALRKSHGEPPAP